MNDLRSSIEGSAFELSTSDYLLNSMAFSQFFHSLLHDVLFEKTTWQGIDGE